MKIQPVQIWKDGGLKEATWMTCHVTADNLKDSAGFYYSLHQTIDNIPTAVIASGNLFMTGQDYEGWQTNEYAWQWVAQKLGLTLIEEEVVPPTEPTQPETQP